MNGLSTNLCEGLTRVGASERGPEPLIGSSLIGSYRLLLLPTAALTDCYSYSLLLLLTPALTDCCSYCLTDCYSYCLLLLPTTDCCSYWLLLPLL